MKKIETKKSKTIKTFAAPAVIVAKPEKAVSAPVAEVAKPEKVAAAPVTEVAKPVKAVVAPVAEVAKPEKVAAAPVAEVAKPEKVLDAPVVEVAKPVQQVPAKKPAAQTTRTTIVAKIDVGFGNALYIRGEGPGLSWDRGLVMDCVSDAQWIVTISDSVGPIVFKFLVNDVTWCVGTDYSVEPGANITLEPTF
jgi:hypothetical protein